MTAKEFATIHAGERAKIIRGTNENFSCSPRCDVPNPIGIIVGWYPRFDEVVLVLEKEDLRTLCWDITDRVQLTIDALPYPVGWRVSASRLEIVAPIKMTKPYPHKCKQCKAPARLNKRYTLCSNVKCKSHRRIRTLFRCENIANKPSTLNADGYATIWTDYGWSKNVS